MLVAVGFLVALGMTLLAIGYLMHENNGLVFILLVILAAILIPIWVYLQWLRWMWFAELIARWRAKRRNRRI